METGAVVRAWGLILTGYRPNLSIEITRECPLRCPGCYAYGDTHLGGDVVLRQLADYKGQELIDGVLGAIKQYRPLHLSIVGGEPLVRYRELEVLLPKLTGPKNALEPHLWSLLVLLLDGPHASVETPTEPLWARALAAAQQGTGLTSTK